MGLIITSGQKSGLSGNPISTLDIHRESLHNPFMPLAYWSDQEDNYLRDGNNRHLSASVMSAKLSGRTRNAVIGRMHRLGIVSFRNRKSVKKQISLNRIKKEIGNKFKVDEHLFETITENSVLVLNAQPNHCRWPLPELHCCGLQIEIDPYCAGHAIIAYETKVEKK